MHSAQWLCNPSIEPLALQIQHLKTHSLTVAGAALALSFTDYSDINYSDKGRTNFPFNPNAGNNNGEPLTLARRANYVEKGRLSNAGDEVAIQDGPLESVYNTFSSPVIKPDR